MPRATCPCGQPLDVPESGDERIVCPKCGARVRVRRGRPKSLPPDGYIRFFCPCGRRLKVSAENPPSHGKCPDCGAVVPVPGAGASDVLPASHPEALTEELSAEDLARLDEWAQRHLGPTYKPAQVHPAGGSSTAIQTTKPTNRVEAGLRVCPKCGKPVHMSAVVCRECGAHVPKR